MGANWGEQSPCYLCANHGAVENCPSRNKQNPKLNQTEKNKTKDIEL